MKARNSHVAQAFDPVPEEFGDPGRFGGHRQVGGPRGNHRDRSLARDFPGLRPASKKPGRRIVDPCPEALLNLARLGRIQAGHQDRLSGLEQDSRHLADLFRRLAEAEDDLGYSLSQGAVDIDPGALGIDEGKPGQFLDGSLDGNSTSLNIRQEFPNSILVHVALRLAGGPRARQRALEGMAPPLHATAAGKALTDVIRPPQGVPQADVRTTLRRARPG